MNFITSQKKRIDKIYKKFVNSKRIYEETQSHLKPVGTRPGKMGSSYKTHENCADGCVPFRPVLTALQTPTYKLSKHLVTILEPLTTNKHKVNNSFNFVTEIVEQDSGNFIETLDSDSLFTNSHLKKTSKFTVKIFLKTTKLFMI